MEVFQREMTRLIKEVEQRFDQLDLLGLIEIGGQTEYSSLASRVVSRFMSGLRSEDLVEDATHFMWEEYELRANAVRLNQLLQDLEEGGVLRGKLDRLRQVSGR